MKTTYELTGKLQRKIDIFRFVCDRWEYACSTNWAKTCKEAVSNYKASKALEKHVRIKANFSKG